ncbi:MAG: fimbrillin family protein [Tidjanibacter sp.]|nr:fimbrillin family protein [Tidjanibacter sp.]
MKISKLLAAMFCFAAIATSCETPFEDPQQGDGQAKKISLFSTMTNFTRATDTAFEEGDQIGLHIVIPQGTYLNNAHFTYTEGALVGEKDYYWYMDEGTESDVYAYYPYSATGNYRAGGYTFTVSADQNRAGGYTASDLMIAHTTSKPTAEAVELPFKHALSKVVVNIDNQLEEEIENVWFSEVYGTTTVSFKSGETTVSGTKGTIKTARAANGDPTWALILVPQENVTPKLIITTVSKKQYTYQLSGEVSFSAGKVSSASITISDDSIYTDFTPVISDWVADDELQFGQSGSTDIEGDGGDGGNTGSSDGFYFHPGVWASDGAWFSAHAWNESTSEDVTLTDNDGDGVYEIPLSAGMTKILFCRMDPAVSSFSWETGVWNQTEDYEIGVYPNNHFFIDAYGPDGAKTTGHWGPADGGNAGGNTGGGNTDGGNTGSASGLGVVGGFAASNWGTDIPLMTTEVAGLTVAKNITFNAGEGFKIRTVGSWDGVNIGAGSINFVEANKYFAVIGENAGDLCVVTAGTYDIYFNQSAMRVYLMTAGTPYTEAVEQTTNGTELEPEQPDSTENVIYFSVGNAAAGSRYAAYFWNSTSNVWASMTDSDGDNIYEVNIPVGYGENVIFCSMSGVANSWNNKVNQTNDLIIPTDGKNLYTLSGSWTNGSWSVK